MTTTVQEANTEPETQENQGQRSNRRNRARTIRVVIRPVKYSPELSRQIGELAAQQRRAYNHAVTWLNRQPTLQSWKTPAVPRHLALQGRISDLTERSRKGELEASERPCGTCNMMQKCWHHTPRWVLNTGVELAHRAQQMLVLNRNRRLAEMAAIEDRRHDWAQNPPQSNQEMELLLQDERRYARLNRAHRRTLALRSRKHGTRTLECDVGNELHTTKDRMSVWIGNPKTRGFRVPLRKPLPKAAAVRSIRLVEVRSKRRGTAATKLDQTRYEAHAAIEIAESGAPAATPDQPDEVLGIHLGVRNAWTTSAGEHYGNDSEHYCKCPRDEHGVQHRRNCPGKRIERLQQDIIAKPGGSGRPPAKVSKKRRRLEVRRRELLRKRTADRRRIFTGHAQTLLEREAPKMLALPGLNLNRMLLTGRGGKDAPGTNVSARAEANRRLALAALGENAGILAREAEKRGIKPVTISPRNASRTCGKCGERNPRNRTRLGTFTCRECGHTAPQAVNQAQVLKNRAYGRYVSDQDEPQAEQDEKE